MQKYKKYKILQGLEGWNVELCLSSGRLSF